MKFRPTHDNRVIVAGVDEASAIVERAADLLTPEYTENIYLLCEGSQRIGAEHPGLRRINPGQEPSNFLQSCRIIVRDGEIVIVSSKEQVLSKQQWRSIGDTLRASAT